MQGRSPKQDKPRIMIFVPKNMEILHFHHHYFN